MLYFFVPSLWLILFSLLFLLIVKALFKEVLPSSGNIVMAVFSFALMCACLYAGMFSEHYLSKSVARWIEKITSLCGLSLFILVFRKKLDLRDIGVCLPSRAMIFGTIAFITCLASMVAGVSHRFSIHQDFSLNRFLFMLMLSGVDEELVFRGLMPALLMTRRDSSNRHRWINRVIVFVVPSALFTLVHAWRFTSGQFSFSGYTFGVIGVGACAFMYLRLRTGSLLNSVVVHNVVNASTVIALSAA